MAIGAKRIETRVWATKYRGPLAIHAGKGLGPVGGKRGFADLYSGEPFRSALLEAMPDGIRFSFGAIVATCNLIACGEIKSDAIYDMGYSTQEAIWGIPQGNELAFGDYTLGRYAWFLTDVKMLAEPIPTKGALGLWDWDGVIS